VAEKGIIVGLYKDGNRSMRSITTEFGINPTTVSNVWKLYQKDPQLKRRPVSGRPRKTTAQDDRVIVRAVKTNPNISAGEIKQSSGFTDICEQTILNRLHESKEVYSAWTKKKPWLCKINREKRIAWCKAHLHWTGKDWNSVVWSDESPLPVRHHGKKRVWKQYEQEFHISHYTPTVKHD
jgi:transposase-like protein